MCESEDFPVRLAKVLNYHGQGNSGTQRECLLVQIPNQRTRGCGDSHRRPSIWARDSGTAPLGRNSASNGRVGSISIFSNLRRACTAVGAYSFNSHYSPCLLRCELLEELLESFPVPPQRRICSLGPWNQSRRSTAPMNSDKPQGCCSQRHYHETMDEHESEMDFA